MILEKERRKCLEQSGSLSPAPARILKARLTMGEFSHQPSLAWLGLACAWQVGIPLIYPMKWECGRLS